MKNLKELGIVVLFTMLVLMLGLLSAGYGQETETIISGEVSLSWGAPETNSDGTKLTDLAGYILHYGSETKNYTTSVDVGNVNAYIFSNLPDGDYFFNITAYDTSGNVSKLNGEVYTKISSVIDDEKPPVEVPGLRAECKSITVNNYIGTNVICKDKK